MIGTKTYLKTFHNYPLSMIYFEPLRDKLVTEVKQTDDYLKKHGVLFVKVRHFSISTCFKTFMIRHSYQNNQVFQKAQV